VVGVDPIEFKRESALRFGATHTAEWAHEAVEPVRELTAGVMADKVVLCAGVVHADLIPVGMMLTRKGGTCVLTGMTPISEMSVPLVAVDMTNSVKHLRGTTYGEMNPRASMPMLLSLYESGALMLDEMVTRRYTLDEINTAISDMRTGLNIRGVIDFPTN
jgi:S-(hydroxymethyl)glutathione dehydrogenase/alcohol dehydrogenase